ncbi:ZIP zinc transporter Zrt1 [Schizosaccharomyces cryophilus OY26]|uniref:ZIP zinc transporter Zrt1 n=1 Tax=Schizosaccharomyces cryophilus (strain OY26 / ATCC MYA-4695 / CBS 11777 / NBRC 106824 / NRRL Y48691) TaxID=653667 RepID=S9W769_SCHCR|nr:ZIP zinc transporter Zrt1 [Schizosaccharomyces cryophilus OY26]EPY53740.1 ZIP zinc transporter Zrt1 [Schizosaccharomyces cryophilus OY26]
MLYPATVLKNAVTEYQSQDSYQVLRFLLKRDDQAMLYKRDDGPVQCSGDSNEYEDYGHMGVRIGAIFVILVTSLMGVWLPLTLSHFMRNRPNAVITYFYLFCRYFGSGVILATAFIHLLAPACKKLYDPCLSDLFGSYDWAPVVLSRFVEWKYGMSHCHSPNLTTHSHNHEEEGTYGIHSHEHCHDDVENRPGSPKDFEDIKLKSLSNTENSDLVSIEGSRKSLLYQQIGAFLVLESGIILHSVIIGLTTAISGGEFRTLFPVVVFHQAFEGTGLGARLSGMAWGKGFNALPWILGGTYAIFTPVGMAAGLGAREHWNPLSHGTYAAQGVLDAISSGILIYAGLVELLAQDFLFDPNRERNWIKLSFLLLCAMAGTALMALLGKWA